jgi:hypothetical protein
MTHGSTAELLSLHAVRLQGFVDSADAAARFGLDPAVVDDHLLDAEAVGWVSRSEFDGTRGWSLTEAGRRANEAALARELDEVGARSDVEQVHDDFLPVNALLADAVTRWQLRPAPHDPLAANTHEDAAWDAAVLGDLARVGAALDGLAPRLAARLPRFEGYDDRFAGALARADGHPAWVAGTRVDSCHRVWFELHEDLIATLGRTR